MSALLTVEDSSLLELGISVSIEHSRLALVVRLTRGETRHYLEWGSVFNGPDVINDLASDVLAGGPN